MSLLNRNPKIFESSLLPTRDDDSHLYDDDVVDPLDALEVFGITSFSFSFSYYIANEKQVIKPPFFCVCVCFYFINIVKYFILLIFLFLSLK